MSIRHVILGFLDWNPSTGYELKKLFAESPNFHWSGNSNQVYGSLLELEREGAVTSEVVQGGRYPSRKVYTITERGRAELRRWLLGEVELPEIRGLFQVRLCWAEALTDAEVDERLSAYMKCLEEHIALRREMARRAAEADGKGLAAESAPTYLTSRAATVAPARSPREALIWRRIEEGRIAAFEAELEWARRLRGELAGF